MAATPEKKPVYGRFTASVEPKRLAAALAVAKTVINRSSPNPIIQHVQLYTNNGQLKLIATNIDLRVELAVGKASQENGRCLVRPEDLSKIKGDVATLELSQDGTLTITQGRNRRDLACTADPDEYPSGRSHAGKSQLWLVEDLNALAESVGYCLPAPAQDKGRYALNGVLFEPKKTKLELCGTDGRRLHYQCLPIKGEHVCERDLIMPANFCRALIQVAKHIGNAPIEAGLRVVTPEEGQDGPQVTLMGKGFRIDSNTVNGQFPDRRVVVPRDHDKFCVIDRDELDNALVAVSQNTTPEHQAVKLFTLPDRLAVKSKSSKGTSRVDVMALKVPHQCTIGVDPKYLLAALDGLPEEITLDLKDMDTGIIVHGGDKTKAYRLVMPIDIGHDKDAELERERWKDVVSAPGSDTGYRPVKTKAVATIKAKPKPEAVEPESAPAPLPALPALPALAPAPENPVLVKPEIESLPPVGFVEHETYSAEFGPDRIVILPKKTAATREQRKAAAPDPAKDLKYQVEDGKPVGFNW